MRILAIGDIHGCSSAFETLLAAFKLHPQDQIVTLGDYVNKGPDSKGVLERLIELHKIGQLIALRGNHEVELLEARSRYQQGLSWQHLLDAKTLASYSPSNRQLSVIPDEHWNFIAKICRDWWQTDHHFFVHACADPHKPLEQQSHYHLFWKKFDSARPHRSGKTMICGHTSQKSGKPVNLGYAICIDTRIFDGGWLTGLDIISGRVWQTNQKGEKRTAWIDDFKISNSPIHSFKLPKLKENGQGLNQSMALRAREQATGNRQQSAVNGFEDLEMS